MDTCDQQHHQVQINQTISDDLTRVVQVTFGNRCATFLANSPGEARDMIERQLVLMSRKLLRV